MADKEFDLQALEKSEDIDVCPLDGEEHPGCEWCTVSNCARGMAILRMRAKED